VLAFRTFLYEAVYIPSGSMIPTLQIGDYVIVEKWAYGARLPFTESAQATWSSPRRGDIVVLLAPPGNPRNDDLIKRVVGIEGDTVEIREGWLVVNGEPVPREQIPGRCTYWNRPEGGPWRQEDCVDYVEQLGEHRYHVYCTPIHPCGDVAPQKVPPGHVWLAGDHRDHSADSRVFGPVPVGRIKGRAFLALASWGPSGPRWDRLFHRISH
jgi:signal peptidase I